MEKWRAFLNRPDMLILLSSALICVLQIHAPDSFKFGYDIGAHMAYIRFVAEHFWLPQPNSCYECHQPFLYYLLNGIVFAAGQAIDLAPPNMPVRILALLVYLAFVGIGMRLMRQYLPSANIYYIALALLAFWPSGIMKSTVVGNDIAEALAQLVCFYYLLLWWHNLQPSALSNTLLWSGLAIAIKQNGIILFAIIATVIFCRWMVEAFSFRSLLCNHKIILSLVFIIAIVFITFGRTYFYFRMMGNAPFGSLVNPKIEMVDYHMYLPHDSWWYYVTFNVQGFFDQPFFIPRNPGTDRYYVWNSLLKSALFGEFRLKAHGIAMLLDILELCMAVYLVATGITALWRKEFDSALLPFFCFMNWQLAMIITARTLYPTANNEDFRFIYVSVAIMATLYGKAMLWHEKHHHIPYVWLGRGLAGLFVSASTLLILFQDAYI